MPDVEIGSIRGYLARPVGDGPWPGVVLVHEVFGLTADIRSHADRYAENGYLALAPDLFAWGFTPRCLVSTFRDMRRGTGRAFTDLEAARTLLVDREDCTGRVGTVGYCMGGGFALLLAPRGFDAAAPNYGPLPAGDPEQSLAGSCPVVASYGGRDRSLPGAAATLETAYSALGVEHDVKEYPAAGHAFMARLSLGPVGRAAGVGHHGPSAEDAWGRILAFFATHLREER